MYHFSGSKLWFWPPMQEPQNWARAQMAILFDALCWPVAQRAKPTSYQIGILQVFIVFIDILYFGFWYFGFWILNYFVPNTQLFGCQRCRFRFLSLLPCPLFLDHCANFAKDFWVLFTYIHHQGCWHTPLPRLHTYYRYM